MEFGKLEIFEQRQWKCDEIRVLSSTGNLVSPITNVILKCVSAQWYYRTLVIAFTSEMFELSHIRRVKWRKSCVVFIAVWWYSSMIRFYEILILRKEELLTVNQNEPHNRKKASYFILFFNVSIKESKFQNKQDDFM